MGNSNRKGRKLLMKKRELKDKYKSFEEWSKIRDWYGNETRTAFSAASEINHRIPHLNSGWIHWSGLYSLLTLKIFALVFIFRLRYINLGLQQRCLHFMVLLRCIIMDVWWHFTCPALSESSKLTDTLQTL